MVPIFGGRDGRFLVLHPDYSLRLARNCVQNPNTPFGIFIVIALLCGFAGALCFEHGQYQFLLSKSKQGSALGIMGIRKLSVSVMQLVAPLVIFVPVFAFLGVNGVPQADGSG
ncbi:nitrite extrusion protein 2 [Escherichia coli]|uniref:Nitrite extrusion protein 2 n=1 Tax=Escherichia coli TaxID=562 RepID=A0A376ZZ79_ECOLX|nr:nitrite extrusion protein 2 [Escherichia coli]